MNAAIALAARESADTPGNSRAGGGSDGVPKKAIRDGRRVGHVAGRAGGCILSAAAAQPIGAPVALEGRLQGSTSPWVRSIAFRTSFSVGGSCRKRRVCPIANGEFVRAAGSPGFR